MWGTHVTVNGRSYFVTGTPRTPDSELLAQASRMAEAQERAELEEKTKPYRDAIKSAFA